jgi:hypothetical protein
MRLSRCVPPLHAITVVTRYYTFPQRLAQQHHELGDGFAEVVVWGTSRCPVLQSEVGPGRHLRGVRIGWQLLVEGVNALPLFRFIKAGRVLDTLQVRDVTVPWDVTVPCTMDSHNASAEQT